MAGVTRLGRLSAACAVALLGAAACGSSSSSSSGGGSSGSGSSSGSASTASIASVGGSVTVWAEWSASEQTAFLNALQPFTQASGAQINYTSKGSNMDTALEAAISGGAPPDVALLPDPGTLQSLAKAGSIKDLTSILGGLTGNYGQAWNQLASYNGKQYGVWFKGANKNTIWYNPAEFQAAGITSPPTSWEQLISDAQQLKSSGITPFSLCSDVGWPVADFWQNVYLKTAGASMYNQLAAHSIKWTDPSVTTAFTTFGQLVGDPSLLLGGVQGALSQTYPECVDKVFPQSGQPQAAMVFEGDFVVSEITQNSKNYAPGDKGSNGATCTADPSQTPCYNFFSFPAPSANSGNNGAVQGAGDVAVMLHDTPQAEALIKYLASPQGAAIWAKAGGFASPNNKVDSSAYPDPVAQADAKALVNASAFVFSLDDLQGSWEKQMWQDLLNFVKNPSSASSIQATMEQQATAALGH